MLLGIDKELMVFVQMSYQQVEQSLLDKIT